MHFRKAKIIAMLLVFPFIQGCYTYKSVTLDELKTGRYYEVEVADGRKIENRLLEISGDSLLFKARNTDIYFLKTNVQTIRRRRTSPVVYVVSAGAMAGAILSVTTNKKPIPQILD